MCNVLRLALRIERLEEFYRRLAGAPPAGSEAEALETLGRILIEVEDELSGVPFDAGYPLNDGRMYPPRPDARRTDTGRADLARYRSRQHNTFISADGAIRIEEVDGQCQFEKPSKDGSQVGTV